MADNTSKDGPLWFTTLSTDDCLKGDCYRGHFIKTVCKWLHPFIYVLHPNLLESGLHTCCTTTYSLKLDWIKYHWQQRIGAIRWRLLSATASVMKSLISWYRTGQHFIEELHPSVAAFMSCQDVKVAQCWGVLCWCALKNDVPGKKKAKSIEHNQANAEIITTTVHLILWRS